MGGSHSGCPDTTLQWVGTVALLSPPASRETAAKTECGCSDDLLGDCRHEKKALAKL